jgi:UDP-N-acetylmuramoyl-tripeptide--D-alanyl-D-alanine ligase
MLTLADALEALTNTRPDVNHIITEAAIDSRQVIPGALFVAFRRGASFALIQRDVDASLRMLDLRLSSVADSADALKLLDFEPPLCLRVDNTLSALQQIARFWRRKLDLRVIGITGSVGKSSTKEMVAEVLGMRYRTLRSPGNLNNEIGLPMSILRLGSGYERACWKWDSMCLARSPSCVTLPCHPSAL